MCLMHPWQRHTRGIVRWDVHEHRRVLVSTGVSIAALIGSWSAGVNMTSLYGEARKESFRQPVVDYFDSRIIVVRACGR